jgi:Arm DNA-binding domain
MAGQRITKRVVDSLKAGSTEYAVWDAQMPGFGVRVRPTGAMSYVVVYRAGSGRGAPVRRFTIASVGKTTPENARRRAQAILGAVAHGRDPAGEKTGERGTATVAELADRFMAEHVEQKRKPGTVAFYRHLLDKIIRPELGATKVDKLTRATVAKLHGKLNVTPFQANRVLAVIGSMYAYGARVGVVPEGTNPARYARMPRRRSISPSRNGASPRSARTPQRRSACYCSRVAAFVKSCTSNGSTSISSAGYCSCPTARPAARRWC